MSYLVKQTPTPEARIENTLNLQIEAFNKAKNQGDVGTALEFQSKIESTIQNARRVFDPKSEQGRNYHQILDKVQKQVADAVNSLFSPTTQVETKGISNPDDIEFEIVLFESECDLKSTIGTIQATFDTKTQFQLCVDAQKKIEVLLNKASSLIKRAPTHEQQLIAKQNELKDLSQVIDFLKKGSLAPVKTVQKQRNLEKQTQLAPVGLYNVSNNCWAASITQMLANSPIICSASNQSKKPLFNKLNTHLNRYFDTQDNQTPVAYSANLHELREMIPEISLNDWIQEDASEALFYLLGKLNDEAGYERFGILPLAITECNDLNTLMDFHYAQFGNHSDLPPDMLFAQAKRFDFSDSQQKTTKLKTDLKVAEFYQPSNSKETYELTSVILHDGERVKSGHYRSLVKKPDGWYLCNDSKTTKLTSQEFAELAKSAYIYQYARII